MCRVAEEFCKRENAKAIVTGESLGQVASQTLDNLYIINSAVRVPIFKPLVGLDKREIEDIARNIGTYHLTAHKVEGCKAVPRTPATTSKLERIEGLEENLGLIPLCAKAAEGISRTAIN